MIPSQRARSERRAIRRVLVSGIFLSIAGILPVFMVGGLALQLAQNLDVNAARIGFATSVFFLGGAVASVHMGRLAERWRPARALRVSLLASAGVHFGLASASSWSTLVAYLALGGIVNALAQPTANLLLVRTVPARRQGLAFALKQSAMPAAAALAGLAVPLVALTLGWRWAFAAGGLASLAAALCVAGLHSWRSAVATGGQPAARTDHRHNGKAEHEHAESALLPLVVLTIGVGFASAAATALVTFLVLGAIAQGFASAKAGILLTVGSLVGIASRLLAGALADKRDDGHVRAIAMMLGIGAIALWLFAVGSPGLYIAATVLAFAAGWGWPGLLIYVVMRQNSRAPAAATGIVQIGTFIGAVVGPFLFGAVVQSASYRYAWIMASGWYFVATVAMLYGNALQRSLARADTG